jgi:alpha-glucosidase
LMYQPWQAQAMRASVNEMEAALPAYAWPNYVLGNHDQQRLATRFGGQSQARLAAMMLLTLRGTPTVYYGDEIGMENGRIPPEKIQDPQGVNLGAERTRDVARTPMQWNGELHAGFSTVEPWLPVSEDYQERNVIIQSLQADSMLSLYRRLFWLRRQSPALSMGNYRSLDADGDVFAYLRTCNQDRKLVVLNFSDQPAHVQTELVGEGRVLFSTHLNPAEEVSLSSINLRPHEGLILDLHGQS